VAVVDDNLLGYLRINLKAQCKEATGYEIVTFYVQEYFQNKGVGKALLNFVWEIYGSSCWLTTWIHNTPAISFYEHLGFKKVGYTYFNLDNEKHKNHILAKR
jgi:diamine N-acetyltransferase